MSDPGEHSQIWRRFIKWMFYSCCLYVSGWFNSFMRQNLRSRLGSESSKEPILEISLSLQDQKREVGFGHICNKYQTIPPTFYSTLLHSCHPEWQEAENLPFDRAGLPPRPPDSPSPSSSDSQVTLFLPHASTSRRWSHHSHSLSWPKMRLSVREIMAVMWSDSLPRGAQIIGSPCPTYYWSTFLFICINLEDILILKKEIHLIHWNLSFVKSMVHF